MRLTKLVDARDALALVRLRVVVDRHIACPARASRSGGRNPASTRPPARVYLFDVLCRLGAHHGQAPPPENDAQASFHIALLVVGLFTNAIIISNMSSALSNIDAAAATRRRKMDALKAYLTYRRVPENRKSIVGYYTYLWSRAQSLDEKSMLDDLPESLQLQLALVLNRALFTKVPVFQTMETKCIVAFVQQLRPFICLPRQLLIQGTKVSALCFVNRGTLEVLFNGKQGHAARERLLRREVADQRQALARRSARPRVLRPDVPAQDRL